MPFVETSTLFSGNYVNPFAAQARALAVATTIPAPQAPQFANLIQEMDQKLKARSPSQPTENQGAQQGTYDFFDFIDAINPLQHIPLISNIYRAITGDEIRPEIRMAGNILFGVLSGPVELAIGIGSAAIDYGTGKPVGDHVLAALAPNLEPIIREEYSIARYLHNPFSNEDSAQIVAVNPQSDVSIKVLQHLQNPNKAAQVYAQTAMVLEQKLNKTSSTSAEGPGQNPAQIAALNGVVSPFAATETITTQAIPNLVRSAATETQAMAKSVAHNLNTVVNLTSDAAAQLSSLAAGTANADELRLQMLSMTGDGAVQLRMATAKNRQLGIALGSSATISQQLDTARQRQITQKIGNKVTTPYDQNLNITKTALQRGQQAVTLGVLEKGNKPYFDQDLNNTKQQAAINPKRGNGATISPLTFNSRALKPNQPGSNYYGVDSMSGLNIAVAMQRALDKYQTLRRN
ncbi:MAG: hypothetical protein HRT36_00750 [Alphaproteobacteria bacterium]|nr:hypothetical protein [Alphaproteobacteria bacterium]